MPFVSLISRLFGVSLGKKSPCPFAYKQVIVMRADLKMRRGKEIAQGAHASMLAVVNHRQDPRVKAWLAGPFTKVAVSIESEEALNALIEKARKNGVLVEPVVDAGRTEFHGVPTLTCAAFGPDTRPILDAITGHLPLR